MEKIQASPPAECDQQYALCKQLAKQLVAPGTHSKAQGELPLPGRIARQQQHGNIAQCDQQDQADHSHQHAERPSILIVVAGKILGLV